jgi:hypothetical protein
MEHSGMCISFYAYISRGMLVLVLTAEMTLGSHPMVRPLLLTLKQLADDGVYVFADMYSPVPTAGATGSIGAPITFGS